MGGEGSNNIWVMPLDADVDVFSLQIHGGWEEERVKLYDGTVLFIGGEGLRVPASVLFAKVTCLM